ncbi:MAG: MobH family relaxase, partial [Lentisphaerota bacterium]
MGKIITAFINRCGNSLFGGRPSLLPEQSPAPDEEIPRYPPFMKGLPAAPVERILATQVDLINAIEHALSLPDDLYQTIAAPVIARYAAFSHLLPASESHHHRGAGGLFRHGLEVAHWATQAAQGCLFATQATPRERKEQELRWRLAVCFAGLLHDIGKPVSDMAVVDRHGEYTWNPCDENLTDWAAQNGIDRYFLRWRENRHKRHEQFSALVIERVLTRASRTYLLAPGPDIMQAMLETIHGLDRGAKLYELVMTADCKSVERDLKAHAHTVDSAMGMPVEKYLFDAMRRLIKSGHWLANEKGARLWRFNEGLHIVWRTGARDIVDTLTKDKVPGIPRDEDTLADILIERGLAIPKTLPDGRHYRYWRMQPQGLEATLYMLRLASAELIFTNEPPVVVEGIEVDDVPEATVTTESKQDTTRQASQPDEQIDKPDSTPECATASDQQPTQTHQEQS